MIFFFFSYILIEYSGLNYQFHVTILLIFKYTIIYW